MKDLSSSLEIMSPGVIIPSWPQTTSCNFRATENSSFKLSINPWRLSQPGFTRAPLMHFSFVIHFFLPIPKLWNRTEKILPEMSFGPFYRPYPLNIVLFPLPDYCRLLFTISIFLEKFWWPVKAEMLTIKTLGYSHKLLRKVHGSMPDEQTTNPLIISRNRHINWLWYQYHPSALRKLFLILNVSPEHPLLNKINNTEAKSHTASSEKTQLFMNTSLTQAW